MKLLKLALFTIILTISCNSVSENDECASMKTIFKKHTDGIYILLPSRGCVGCIVKTINFLDSIKYNSKRKQISLCLYDSTFYERFSKYYYITFTTYRKASKSGLIPYFPYIWQVEDKKIKYCNEISANFPDSIFYELLQNKIHQ